MISCPHCHQYVQPASDGAAFDCVMCGERIHPSAKSSSTKVIALGVGVAVVIGVAAYIALRGEAVEEKFQPAYGAPVTDVKF